MIVLERPGTGLGTSWDRSQPPGCFGTVSRPVPGCSRTFKDLSLGVPVQSRTCARTFQDLSQDIPGSVMGAFQNTLGYSRSFQDMFTNIPGPSQDMFQNILKHIPEHSRTCSSTLPGHVPDHSRTCSRTFKTCSRTSFLFGCLKRSSSVVWSTW